MLYLFETKLFETSTVFYSLKSIGGLGKIQSKNLCKKLGFSSNLKIKNLSSNQANSLLKLIELSKIQTSGDLKKNYAVIVKKLVSIKCYRGLRKIKGLPVRGQRTHTNAKTASKFRK